MQRSFAADFLNLTRQSLNIYVVRDVSPEQWYSTILAAVWYSSFAESL